MIFVHYCSICSLVEDAGSGSKNYSKNSFHLIVDYMKYYICGGHIEVALSCFMVIKIN